MKKYKELKRMYYNIFKAQRYYLISYGVKFPSKNFYSLKFLRKKAFEFDDIDDMIMIKKKSN